MTPEHWQAQWEVYSEACKQIARERRDWAMRGYVTPPEVDASEKRRFVKYLRLAREARAHLDAMEEKRDAA